MDSDKKLGYVKACAVYLCSGWFREVMVGHKVDIMTTEATETSRAIKESPYMVFN